ncbi:hybrid sensor histidine kinase/response regulator [Massilia sp. S19_KUP03_FR1]|uniref:hybrid sensor histidine kinase/response regulator n=1 Tax=Massilia sp. S19_KUP03_FR1 TaxID=3025503 RepID=UPI002FCD9AE2
MRWSKLAAPALWFLGGVASALTAGRVGRAQRPGRRVRNERRVDLASRLDAFEHVTDSAGIGLYFWNMATDTLTWSQHHYAIFGYDPALPASHAMFRARIHPQDLDTVDAAVDLALSSRSDYLVRFRVQLPDGALRYVRGSGRATYGADGRPAALNGAVIDITETTEAVHATRQRELDLATVAANLPDIINRYDRQRRCLFVSPRIEALTGQPAAWFLGKTHEELGLDPVLAARWSAVLEDVIRNGTMREFDFAHVGADGVERFYITRALPSFGPDGRVETVLTISTDHTEREREARQLRLDGAMLEKADLRKNEYLATLAHELRGPLAPISSAVQLLGLSDQPAVREKARGVIERQVAQLASLVGDLMEVGRISSGKLAIERARVQLRHVIDQAVEASKPLLDARRQALSVELPHEDAWLDADALRLVQAFSNLLTNASKYSPRGAPVAIQARANGKHVEIKVADQGIGLTEEAMRDIFDLFVQVNPTGVQAQGGLGIGLSLVRQLVELHGGSVAVHSAGLGQGACFTVRLPLGRPQADLPLPHATPTPPARGLKVLVVDDNADGAQTLAALLDALGHQAVTAFNGRDAVRLAAEQAFDLAFLDLGLPDISGIQVALTIRGTARGKQLPLVALTGLGRDQDRYLTQAAQFTEHLVKPLAMDDLLRITEAVAARRDAGTMMQ